MTNHPNRNWRKRMEQAADQWLESVAGKVLAHVPLVSAPDERVQALRYRLREAYLHGYADGRKRATDSE